jgi:hypothetical protein
MSNIKKLQSVKTAVRIPALAVYANLPMNRRLSVPIHAGLLARASSLCQPSRSPSGIVAQLFPYSGGNRAGISPASLSAGIMPEHETLQFSFVNYITRKMISKCQICSNFSFRV